MKVLALTPNPVATSPGHRFRLGQWVPFLREQGIEIVCAPFASEALVRILYQRGHSLEKVGRFLGAYSRQLTRIANAKRFDLVYVFREAALIGPAWIEGCIARRGLPIVFDFDDAIFLRYKSPSNGYWSYLKFPGKTSKLCRLARQVMAGNDYLASYASRFNDEVTIVPTTIDVELYRPVLRRAATEPPTIGWTGSHSTAQHLITIVPALEELARHRRFRLLVVGAEPPAIRGVEVEARPWRAASEAQDLSDVDVGIMPLPDDDWSRGKCGLKALQFMALGIPTVVSPVGVNLQIVRHGENGLVAGTERDWVEKLSSLLESAERRHRLGARARHTVVGHYSARSVAPRVVEVFRRAVETPAPRYRDPLEAARKHGLA